MSSGDALPVQTQEHYFGIGPLCDAVGLDKTLLTTELMAQYIIPCTVGAFSGEEMPVHARLTHENLRQQLGESFFRDGSFGRQILELSNSNNSVVRDILTTVVPRYGSLLAKMVMSGQYDLHQSPTVKLDRRLKTVSFDKIIEPITPGTRALIDFGPGLQGRHRIREQITDIAGQEEPYSYTALCKGPLIKSFLDTYWTACFSPHLPEGIYQSRDDGIAAGTTALLDERIQPQKKKVDPGIADLIIASEIQEAGREELRVGFENAYQLLRRHGALLIRAPERPNPQRPDDISGAAMINMAWNAGFENHNTRIHRINVGERALPMRWLSVTLRK